METRYVSLVRIAGHLQEINAHSLGIKTRSLAPDTSSHQARRAQVIATRTEGTNDIIIIIICCICHQHISTQAQLGVLKQTWGNMLL